MDFSEEIPLWHNLGSTCPAFYVYAAYGGGLLRSEQRKSMKRLVTWKALVMTEFASSHKIHTYGHYNGE